VADLERELAESRAREAALSEVLAVMSRVPPDLQAVLDTVVMRAAQLCDAGFDGSLFLVDGDRFHLAAATPNANPKTLAWRATVRESLPLDRGFVVPRVVRTKHVFHVNDATLESDTEAGRQDALDQGYRSILGVPLLRGDEVIGVLSLLRAEVRAFADHEIGLVRTFADQAAIAIENARLFNETTEALAKQTATTEVLRVMSRTPFELQSVLDTVLENAIHLCAADTGSIIRIEGAKLRRAAERSRHADEIEFAAYAAIEDAPIDRSTVTGRVVIERRPVRVADIQSDPELLIKDRPGQDPQSNRSALGVPLLRQDDVLGVIVLRRYTVWPFTDAEVALVEDFARQAVIAIENVRLFNKTKESLEQQTATREVLEVISASAFDLEVVFRTIVENAVRLCRADNASFLRPDGDLFIQVANAGAFEDPKAYERVWRARRFVADRGTLAGRVILERRTIQIDDVLADTEYDKAHLVLDVRTMLGVPVLHDRRVIGIIIVRRKEVRPFNLREIEILETFAHQAAIAIENVRLFNETKEALERQTATAEILKVISASPSDLQPVFDSIGEHARVLCSAERVHLWLRKGDRLELVATGHDPAVEVDLIRVRSAPLDRSNMAGRAILGRVTIHVADVLADPEYDARIQEGARPWRTVLAVPLIREDDGIGAIALVRSVIEPFEDRQIELVRTFADQAVIAIENVRLFNETKEALAQQTAVADVLASISRSAFDLDAVLQTIVDRAAALCGADVATLRRLEGQSLVQVAYFGPPGLAVPGNLPADGPTLAAVSVRTLERQYVEDVRLRPELPQERTRTRLAVPIVREGRALGTLILTHIEVHPFTDQEIRLVETFADQAGIAMENMRLFSETKEGLEQQTAVSEVLKTISRSAFDLQPVLDIVLENAVRLAGADIGWLSRVEGAHFKTVAYSSKFPADVKRELIERRAQGHAGGGWVPLGPSGGIMGKVTAGRRTIHLADVKEDPELSGSLVARLTESRTVLGVPMVRDERAIGGIILTRYEVRMFSDRETELVQTFADQAAIAIENVRLFNDIQTKSQQLEVASQHKSEFLANMSHELRTPLNAIIGFSEVMLERMFGDLNERQEEYLKDILSSGRHLLSLINDILDLSKIEAGRMELERGVFSLRTALENGVTMVRERASRHGIALEVAIGDDLDAVAGDERKVKQVVYNLLSNAVKFTPDGGRVDVRAARQDGAVQVTVRDTGIGIAPEDQERIFEEFSQVGRDPERSREGTGLGLTLSKRYVELHGGRIWVESEPGHGSAFSFTLPQR
jgi:GAF domain-containing protein